MRQARGRHGKEDALQAGVHEHEAALRSEALLSSGAARIAGRALFEKDKHKGARREEKKKPMMATKPGLESSSAARQAGSVLYGIGRQEGPTEGERGKTGRVGERTAAERTMALPTTGGVGGKLAQLKQAKRKAKLMLLEKKAVTEDAIAVAKAKRDQAINRLMSEQHAATSRRAMQAQASSPPPQPPAVSISPLPPASPGLKSTIGMNLEVIDLPSPHSTAIEDWLDQIEAQGDGRPASHAEGDTFFLQEDGGWQRDDRREGDSASESSGQSASDLAGRAAERLAGHAQEALARR